MEADLESSFARSVCLPFLRNAQNADGGWGFHPGAQSRAEPTCWALLALINSPDAQAPEAVVRGLRFLRAAQLPDASWPATPEQKTGSWITSLACWVLESDKDSAKEVAAGLLLAVRGLAPGQHAVAALPRAIFVSAPCGAHQQLLPRLGMDAPDKLLGRADLVCPPRTATRPASLASRRGSTTPTARRSHALRSHVPWRRLELRQSQRLWRCGRASGCAHGLGPSRPAGISPAARNCFQPRLARSEHCKHSGCRVTGARADLPGDLRSQLAERSAPTSRSS